MKPYYEDETAGARPLNFPPPIDADLAMHGDEFAETIHIADEDAGPDPDARASDVPRGTAPTPSPTTARPPARSPAAPDIPQRVVDPSEFPPPPYVNNPMILPAQETYQATAAPPRPPPVRVPPTPIVPRSTKPTDVQRAQLQTDRQRADYTRTVQRDARQARFERRQQLQASSSGAAPPARGQSTEMPNAPGTTSGVMPTPTATPAVTTQPQPSTSTAPAPTAPPQ